jgi:hypothetical protein
MMVVATATSQLLTITWGLLLGIVPAIVVFMSVRHVETRLTATGVEFYVDGYRGRRNHVTRSLLTANIQRLEFQERTSGRQGLYAVTSWRDHCILPFVDYRQAGELIDGIERKFPGLAEMWRKTATGASADGISGRLL